VAYVTYIGYRAKSIWLVGIFSAASGCFMETVALGLRWYSAGLDHPPFTNMYESLVFFAWGIVLVYIIVETIYKIRIAGAFIVPVALVAMGLASLSPDKAILPLVPALQSIWLHIHVATASIGYAAFLVAFGFSMLLLFKLGTSFNHIFATASVINVFGLLAASKGQALFFKFKLTAVEKINDVTEKIYIPGTFDPPQFEQINLGTIGALSFLTMLGFVISSFFCVYSRPPSGGKASRVSRLAFRSAMLFYTLLLILLVYNFFYNSNISITANPYTFALIAAFWFFSFLFIIVDMVHPSFLKALPKSSKIDEMAYRSIMVAFPIMTLIIVTGAIWANQAWGRYWGWDPKETASLVTWIIYLLYLHTRITKGWTGKRSAYISIIGFISVVFTFLGVNLLLSGLHAYATG